MSTIQIKPGEEAGPALQPRQRKMKLALLLTGLVFAAVVFLSLDWFHTAAMQRAVSSANHCKVPDPVRHHAFQPNCTAVEHWGGNSFEFVTNSLGFRDEKVREVPLADAQPRVLMLGDSFTEGPLAWRESYVGRITAHFPQYDFLNGGVGSYAPSNYLNTARMVLVKGVDIDEVIVFLDISDAQDEAAFYQDIDAYGSVIGPKGGNWFPPGYAKWRFRITTQLALTDQIFRFFERILVGHGHYQLTTGPYGDAFDMEKSAWTYRKVNEAEPYPAGYAPLGLQVGLAKEEAKMTLLWQELAKRNIPISVVVYPYPAQLLYDTADSLQVRMWRNWCEGKCKRFVSLFPAFFAAKDQCPRSRPGCWYEGLFIFGDTHYNAVGNALVADAVIKSLAEEPPVKRP